MKTSADERLQWDIIQSPVLQYGLHTDNMLTFYKQYSNHNLQVMFSTRLLLHSVYNTQYPNYVKLWLKLKIFTICSNVADRII
jgi:hypothetical protein